VRAIHNVKDSLGEFWFGGAESRVVVCVVVCVSLNVIYIIIL
jgi:hypothetical protein